MESHTVVEKINTNGRPVFLRFMVGKTSVAEGITVLASVRVFCHIFFVFLDFIVPFSLFSIMSFFFPSPPPLFFSFFFFFLFFFFFSSFFFFFFFPSFSSSSSSSSPRPFIMRFYTLMASFIFFSSFSCNVVLDLHCQGMLHSGNSVSLLYALKYASCT